MKTVLLTSAFAAALLAGLPADASPKGGRGNGNGNGAWLNSEFCPPGLRDRDPACVPPGHAGRDIDEKDDDGDDGAEFADRIEADLDGLVHQVELSRDERQALAIIGGLMGLALHERRTRAAEADEAPTVARLVVPQAPPVRPAWIEALAPTYLGDAAADDAADDAAGSGALEEVAAAPNVVAPAPVPPSALIPPPPPLAEDVSDLVGGSVTDSGF